MSKKVSVLITEPAQSDITVIADYIARNNQRAAVGFLNILEETFKVIVKYPFAGTQKIGVKYIFVTDISKDGTLTRTKL